MAWSLPLQLAILRFLLGFADGALMPAVQALLLKYSRSGTGRIFGYNQSFMYLGNHLLLIGAFRDDGVPLGVRRDGGVGALYALRHQFKKGDNARDNGNAGKRPQAGGT